MKRQIWLCFASMLLLALTVVPPMGSAGIAPKRERFAPLMDAPPTIRPTAGPLRVIVELEGEPAAMALRDAVHAGGAVNSARAAAGAVHSAERAPSTSVVAYRASLARQRADLVQQASEQGIRMRVEQTYDIVYHGFAAALERPEDAARLAALPGVKAVHDDGVRELYLERSAAWVGAGAPGVGTGKGVVACVVDSGIDWTHLDLGGNGPGEITTFPTPKVIGGWDFVGDDYRGPGNPLKPDPYPNDQMGHGTHVAGIIGAKAHGEGGVTGVAPDVLFRAYKVFGIEGATSTSTVVAAIERAVADGCDVINLSLGASLGRENDPGSRAVDNAALAGVVSAVAAGNSGPGTYTLGSPAAAKRSIAVGAFTDDGVGIYYARLVDDTRDILYNPMINAGPVPEGGVQAPYVFVGLGLDPDYIGKDVTGKIALIQRGQITFGEKARRAQEKGAVAAVIFNNQPGEFQGWIDPAWGVVIPAVGISDANGAYLLTQLESKELFLDPTLIPTPDRKAAFTSEGPTRTHHWLKPDVTAPGVAINSALPYEVWEEGYDSWSGTSMATPHVAGAAAILKQMNPHWGPNEIKAALMNTARWIEADPADPKVKYSLVQQGAGMIDLRAATAAKALAYSLNEKGEIDSSSFSFGQIAGLQPGTWTQTGLVRGKPGAPVGYTVLWKTEKPGLSLKVEGDGLIKPDGTATFTVTLRSDLNIKPPGAYGGQVIVKVAGRNLHLPFMVVVL
jgi:minor extracellular serine protease Vpr